MSQEVELADEIVIDFGTENVVALSANKGLAVNEPSIVARDISTGKALAMGKRALAMQEEVPGSLILVRPVVNASISDLPALQSMGEMVIKRCRSSRLHRSKVIVCVSPATSSLEKQSIRDVLKRGGASGVRFVSQVVAASAYAGVSPADAAGALVVDIGAGKTCVSAVSLGGVIDYATSRAGGEGMNIAIRNLLRHERGIVVSLSAAEEIRLLVGGADGSSTHEAVEVSGHNALDGQKENIVVKADEVRMACEPVLEAIFEVASDCLSKIPPEITYDLASRGVLLIGGLAMMNGLAEWLSDKLGLLVSVPDEPQTCTVRGAYKLAHMDGNTKGIIEET
jgi:rod shape-determining protein MreB